MAAGHEPRSALTRLDVMRIPEELNIEVWITLVYDCVDVQRLHVRGVRLDVVLPIMVKVGPVPTNDSMIPWIWGRRRYSPMADGAG